MDQVFQKCFWSNCKDGSVYYTLVTSQQDIAVDQHIQTQILSQEKYICKPRNVQNGFRTNPEVLRYLLSYKFRNVMANLKGTVIPVVKHDVSWSDT